MKVGRYGVTRYCVKPGSNWEGITIGSAVSQRHESAFVARVDHVWFRSNNCALY